MVVAHAELRSAPLAITSQRVGGLLFCDVGDAANTFAEPGPAPDVGAGSALAHPPAQLVR